MSDIIWLIDNHMLKSARQIYYEENNICTQVNEYGFAGQENVLYNHVHYVKA